jgi:hypothetical protein
MMLADSNVFEKLRYVRRLVYQNLYHATNPHRYRDDLQIVEITRKGQSLDVSQVTCCSDDSLSGVDSNYREQLLFFQQIMRGGDAMSSRLERSEKRVAWTWCSTCKRIFDARYLQMEILAKLLGVVFPAASADEGLQAFNTYSFQLSMVLLLAKHLCHELQSLPCECFKTSNFLAGNDMFKNAPPAAGCESAARVLTDFQLTNLWSTMEACVLHCDYVTSCVCMRARLATGAGPGLGLGLGEVPPGPEERSRASPPPQTVTPTLVSVASHTRMTHETLLQFPLECLNPSHFAGIHREVVLNRKSRHVDAFLADLFSDSDGMVSDSSEKNSRLLFLSFVQLTMAPE